MKNEIIEKLDNFRDELRALKKELSKVSTKRVSRKHIRESADTLATKWVEDLRSPLEHKFKLAPDVIQETSSLFKRLHILSRPNNLTSSYVEVLKKLLYKFDDKFILPIKQSAFEVESILDLNKIIPNLKNPEESEYLSEAINCANSGFCRASIVMGWCAVIDRIQKKIMAVGFDKFNSISRKIKNQRKGKFKWWNKEFNISTLSELQSIFDNDLIIMIEAMELIDGNQSDRLKTCFQYRNHCAHPGLAPIEEPNLVAFFSDINSMILQNPKFDI